jgi:hypothetical protein
MASHKRLIRGGDDHLLLFAAITGGYQEASLLIKDALENCRRGVPISSGIAAFQKHGGEPMLAASILRED